MNTRSPWTTLTTVAFLGAALALSACDGLPESPLGPETQSEDLAQAVEAGAALVADELCDVSESLGPKLPKQKVEGDVLVVTGTQGRDVIDCSGVVDEESDVRSVSVTSGGGNDDIVGSDGDDFISSGGGDDMVRGGDGRDDLTGGPGCDLVDGGLGDDIEVDGGPGDDSARGCGFGGVFGGEGDDLLNGGPGDDHLDGGLDDDELNGGPGTDSCVEGASDTFAGCETVVEPPIQDS